MSIAGKAAIIGAGCSAFAEHWTKSAEDLVVDAVLEAYADAGIVEPGPSTRCSPARCTRRWARCTSPRR